MMCFPLEFICLSSGFDGPVIRLRTACCEINFVGFGSQGLCDGLACLCDGFFRWSCKLIHRRRISIIFCEIWQHCLYDLWSGFGRCRIVKINCFFHVVVIRLSVVIKLKASSTHFIIFAYSYHCNRISSYFFLNKVILCNNPHLRGPFYERFLPQALHDHWNFTSDCGWICRPGSLDFFYRIFLSRTIGAEDWGFTIWYILSTVSALHSAPVPSRLPFPAASRPICPAGSCFSAPD